MIPRIRSTFVLVFTALLIDGCQLDWVREHPLGCRADEKALVRDTLYFGLAIPGGGEITPDQWAHFESDVLLPAFPHGFSVLDSHGPWRGADGRNQVEASHMVVIVHDDDVTSASSLRRVIAHYKSTYGQEAVLRERAAVCVTF
ncbi:MAG: DUF3574 domain-containing protein [Dokdonella sp.]|uniref:DUF3574 domain-containing protein n=1 Tax=Dokdonella sp. TaxID=2291710 RepID=UPI0032642487